MTNMIVFTKLFHSILDSSIWCRDDKTRILWITMLAMADKIGTVNAALPGLAGRARMTIEECGEALGELMAPDPYSRTKEYDGRRIEEIEGGWRILNYMKYRDLGMDEQRKAYFRAKKREERSKTDKVDPMSNCKQNVQDMSNSLSVSVSVSDKKEGDCKEGEDHPVDVMFREFWEAYPRKIAKTVAYTAFWKTIKAKASFEDIMAAVHAHSLSDQWKKDDGKFIPYASTWLNQKRWEDVLESSRESSRPLSIFEQDQKLVMKQYGGEE
jgi:hypothetical protein